MKKLSELVTVKENNENCVVLKVKANKTDDLIALGYFSGDETLIRVTKGRDHMITVWRGTEHFSWEWGYSGNTCVSHGLSKQRIMVVEAIKDLGIKIE